MCKSECLICDDDLNFNGGGVCPPPPRDSHKHQHQNTSFDWVLNYSVYTLMCFVEFLVIQSHRVTSKFPNRGSFNVFVKDRWAQQRHSCCFSFRIYLLLLCWSPVALSTPTTNIKHEIFLPFSSNWLLERPWNVTAAASFEFVIAYYSFLFIFFFSFGNNKSVACGLFIMWDNELQNTVPHLGAESPCRDGIIKMLCAQLKTLQYLWGTRYRTL